MTGDEERIKSLYDEALRLKELARTSVERIDLYLEAAKLMRRAALLSTKCAEGEGNDIDTKVQHEVFSLYYPYEEHHCLAGYYYEKRDTRASTEHLKKACEYLRRAVARIENLPPGVPPETKERLAGFLPNWRHFQRHMAIQDWGNDARAAWDDGRYIEALDAYRKISSHYKALIKNTEFEAIGSPYQRIAVANFIGAMANTSSALAMIMQERAAKKDQGKLLEMPFDLLVRILRHTLDAYRYGNAAFEHNPEWEQYRDAAQRCLNNIQNVLRMNPSAWVPLYVAFEDDPEFLRVMKMTDLERFKEAEAARHARENKLVKLWAVGSFWLLVLSVVAALVLVVASLGLTWWQLLAAIAAIEVIFVLIGAFTLRTIGELSEKNFLTLVGKALEYQFKFWKVLGREAPLSDEQKKISA